LDELDNAISTQKDFALDDKRSDAQRGKASN
jgi:hypothetical protein